MFNVKMEFTSKIWVPVDKALAKMLTQLDAPIPGVESTITHTMTVSNTPVIPNKDVIQKMTETIKEELQNKLAPEGVKVKETVFVGFKTIDQF